jgi:ABC-type lipoprotein release transport system permease subunit
VSTGVPLGALVSEAVGEVAVAASTDPVGDGLVGPVVSVAPGVSVVPVVSVVLAVPVALVAAGVSSATATAGAARRAASTARPADSERARRKDVFMGPLRKG